jgi:hypothetical protein
LDDLPELVRSIAMKKLVTKDALTFAGAAMATCALLMPSMAGAASWGVIGTEHTLDSPDLGFTSADGGGLTTACPESSFTVSVQSASTLTITGVTFRRCTTSGPTAGLCTVTSAATHLPWTATAISTSTIQIGGVHFDELLEDERAAPGSCFLKGVWRTITGTLEIGSWTASQHEVTFSNAEGLAGHSALGIGAPVTTRGTLRDTQQTLTVNP